MTRFYDEALAPCGMTVGQFAILRNLRRHGPLPLSRLADLLVTERTSLYRTLAPLEGAGWIEVTSATSGRAKIGALTVAGEEAIATATPAWERAQRGIVGSLGEEQWQAAERLLGTLTGLALEQAG